MTIGEMLMDMDWWRVFWRVVVFGLLWEAIKAFIDSKFML